MPKTKSKSKNSFLLKNVRPWAGDKMDVLVRDGVIEKIAPEIKASDGGLHIYEGNNEILFPGLVNAHAHIDNNLLGVPWPRNEVPAAGIEDMIMYSQKVWRTLKLSPRTQAIRQLRASAAVGITHIRSHANITPEVGNRHFMDLLEVREEFKDLMTIELVAFPQLGIVSVPGTRELIEEALQKGVECVGGIDPSNRDRDPVGHLDAVFALADKYGKKIDIHLHEPGPLGAFSVELIAERTKALGMQGRVTISHVFCLGMVSDSHFGKLAKLLADNQITIQSAGAGGTPLPPIKQLVEAGVPMCIGTDGVRDIWSGLNSVDMLDRIRLLAYRLRYKRDDEIEMLLQLATRGGARAMGDGTYGFEESRDADMLIMPGTNQKETVVDMPPRTYVFKRGVLVAKDGECLQSE